MNIATLTIFKNITENLDYNSVFVTDPSVLLTKMVNLYDRYITNFSKGDKDLTDRSIVIIMNCITKLRMRDVLIHLSDFLLSKYYEFYNNTNLSDQKVRLASVISLLHTCVLAFENCIPRDGFVSDLCKLVDNHITAFGVEEEGLNMISSMAIALNKGFEQYSKKYLNHAMAGLQLIQEPKVFKVALCCIGDFSRTYG